MVTKRRVGVAAATVVVLGGSLALAGASASGDAPAVDRAPAVSAQPSPAGRSAARLLQRSDTVPLHRSPSAVSVSSKLDVKRTLKGLVKAHNKLVRKHNKLVRSHKKLVKKHNKLARDVVNCEKTVNVTSYSGYDYNGNIGATSALDFTEPGDPVDARMLVYVC